MHESEDITKLLNLARGGDRVAESRLLELLYSELRRIANSYLRSEGRNRTIQPTALVNEAYLRLNGARAGEWKSRTHFLAVAARAMRRVLVDCARVRHTKKRGGEAWHVEFHADAYASDPWEDEVLDIDAALHKLAALDERQAIVVELKFFAGLTEVEIGKVVGCSERTVKREWDFARAWLEGELAEYASRRSTEGESATRG
jgi:RNA polymerase sigma factor (TIGR02999 family)